MLSVVVFSKDRPLQLQAYLESLLYYSDINDNCIYILYKSTETISYKALISQYPNVNWISENNFYNDLLNILGQAENYILWGCDDVFYKSAFHISTCIEALSKDEECFGFSLRLGRNIQPNPSNELIERDSYLVWDWTKVDLPHPLYPQEVWDWGYPWELSGSIYRKSDIYDFLKLLNEPKNPNYFEGDLASIFRSRDLLHKRKYLACFPLSKCLTLTVNRVQHTHPNAFDAAKNTNPNQLYKYLTQGYKLNWYKFRDCSNPVIQVGSEYFEIELSETRKNTSVSSPLVSIICRVYNREEYIEDTIISVLNQTFEDFEFLILDDGSTDNTRKIVEKCLQDSRIKYVYQENIGKNLDAFDQLTDKCVALTSGELVAIIDSDDICISNRLERQVAEFKANPDVDVVFSDAYHIDANGNNLIGNFQFRESFVFNNFNLLRTLFKINIIPNPTVMIRRTAIELMGGFENGFAPDYHFWLKSAPFLNFKYIDEKLVKYRIHDNSSSTGVGSQQRVFQESVNILWETRNRFSILDLYPEVYGCQNRQKAMYSAYLDFGNTMLTANIPVPEMASQEYQKALKYNPQGIEALNNLAVVFWALGDVQNCLQIFDYLKNTAYNIDAIKHNVDLVDQLQSGITITNKNFVLLSETNETSELLESMESSNIILSTSKTNMMQSFNSEALPQSLVSVIIPCYNHAKFMREAVESVINQTYQNWECIIVNDGSPDRTSEVAKHLIEIYKHKNIRLLEKPNSGVVESRNMGLEYSSGQFILFLDADDQIHPNFLEETVAVLTKNPSVGFVYTDIQEFGVKHNLVSYGDFDPGRFLRANQVPVTSLFRREINDQIGGFKKVMEIGWEDWEFWISAYEKGWQGYRLGKPYLFYRQHSNGSRLQTLHGSQSNLFLQRAKIIKLHFQLYNQQEILWAEQILHQHNSPLAMGLTELNLRQQISAELQHIKYPSIDSVPQGIYRPKWSVMIPTYNPHLEYLEKTLISVLEQDLGVDQMQIEVVDDRSTKNDPEELVRKIGQGRVSFYRQPKNLGLIGNWNACISRARGHLVHILHQDDVVKPGFYRRLEAAFVQEPSIGAAFCRYFYMDEKGCERDLSLLERETPGVIPNWIERIAVTQRIECPSIVVKREVYEKLGGFCQEAHYAADWEMWKRIAAHYSVWYEPELLASYRSHSSSETSRLIKSGANIADTLKAIEISQSYLPTTISTESSNQARENCAFKALNIARHLLSKGDVDAAIAQIREGIKSSQSSNTILSVLELVQEIVRDSYQYNLLPIDALKLFLSAFQEAFQKQEAIALIESLKLRETNFIIFPDWSQPEDILYQDLASAMTSLMNHPDRNQTTLLIDRDNLTEEEATLFVSGVVMNLVMEEGLDVADELEISLVGQLNEMQWEVLSSRINARIVLEHENKQAIAQSKAEKIPTYEIPSFSELTSVLT